MGYVSRSLRWGAVGLALSLACVGLGVRAEDQPDPRGRGPVRGGIKGQDRTTHLRRSVVEECEQTNDGENAERIRRQGKVPLSTALRDLTVVGLGSPRTRGSR